MPHLREGLRRYLSLAALEKLAAAKVGIAGAGGLGSNVAMLLVRSGIRRLRIVDHDRVEASNLNRQWYWPGDLGRPKVEALRNGLSALEPELCLETFCRRLEPEGACVFFQGCDLVVEALDDAPSKAALCSALLAGGYYVVAASGLGGFALPPLQVRRMGASFVCVGDFNSAVDEQRPPLAPRVMQAAALQADAVLERVLQGIR